MRLGGVIFPPLPAFYHRPQTILDLIHQTIGKALDQVGIEHALFQRWSGHGSNKVAMEHLRGFSADLHLVMMSGRAKKAKA